MQRCSNCCTFRSCGEKECLEGTAAHLLGGSGALLCSSGALKPRVRSLKCSSTFMPTGGFEPAAKLAEKLSNALFEQRVPVFCGWKAFAFEAARQSMRRNSCGNGA